MATTLAGRPDLPAYLSSGPKRLLIGGEWVEAASGRTFDSIDPSTGSVIVEMAEGDAADIEAAVAAARAAFAGPWRRTSPADRELILLRLADLVEAHAQELALLDVVDMGAPLGKRPTGLVPHAVSTLRYYAGWATKIHGETLPNSIAPSMFTYTLKEPVGVVGSIIPWNAPLMSAVWKIAPVLATGCTMVLKPAEQAALSVLRLGELIGETDLPDGVVNIVTGPGHTAGAALAAHPRVDKVAFTGSSATGREIVKASAGNLKRVSLELGGKSPDIVFADADLDAAVPGAGMAVFANSGQICAAGTRVFVERPIHDEFVERLSAFAGTLKVGPSLDPGTQIGPIVSQAQLDRVTGYLEIGVEEGARPTAGGARITDGELADGYFVPPTVFADVHDGMRIAQEEIFGPVASVMPFDSMDEVVERANATEFGLGSGVWTRDVGKAHHLAGEIRAGVVWVNTYNLLDPAVPFGGYKQSGWGNELGSDSLEEYLNVKAVWINAAT